MRTSGTATVFLSHSWESMWKDCHRSDSLHELKCPHEMRDSRNTKEFSHSVITEGDEGRRRGKQGARDEGYKRSERCLHFKWMVHAGWWIASRAFSFIQISCIIHLYANRTAVVQLQYQEKRLWYSRQTFVSLLCWQHLNNEATGTNPAPSHLCCSLKTSLITASANPITW